MRKKQQTDLRRKSGEMPRNSIYSYHSNRSRLDDVSSRRNTARERRTAIRYRTIFRYLPSIVAGAAILASFVYVLGISPNAQIRVLARTEEAMLLRDESVYRQTANELFKRHLTNRSKLTVNTTAIAKDMHRRFPELASVSVTLPLAGRRPIVTIEPVEPAVIVAAQNGRFVVDSNGRNIMAYDDFNGPTKAQLPVVIDESGLSFEVGPTVLPKEAVSFISSCLYQLEEKGIQTGELVLPAIAQELHIPIKNTDYFIKANIGGDARQQMGAFIAVQSQLKREGRQPREYVDVRVENRVYYK